MLDLADARRSGQHPEYTSTWGGIIGSLPDFKTFELVLETFTAKKRQLDTVVECASTWKFPLRDTRYELVHDGSVESLNWKDADAEGDCKDDSELGRAQDDSHDPEKAEEFEQSTMLERHSVENTPASLYSADFHDDGITNNDHPESSQQDLHNPGASEHPDQSSASGRSGEEDISYQPTESSDEDMRSESNDDYSPIHDSDGMYFSEDDADEAWMYNAHEFEVRIIRFRRKRAD